MREVWRNDPLSADVEKQVLERHAELLSSADHKARMEKRLFADDNDAALRAARRLGGAAVAIAQARIALDRKPGDKKKPGDGKKQLDAVPADARDDPGYIFAQVQFLRRGDKIADAARVLLSAPRELAQIHDPEEWWVERRIMSRKLLDVSEVRSAYQVVAEAAEPTKENSRVERHFMAGWIALRFLDDPATAATHFARIRDASGHPTSLARAHYWLGRVAEASGRPDQARAEYEAAASASAAYYGQLARARLGLGTLALAAPPAKPDKRAEAKRPELVRALEILYALNERALAIALMAGIGEALDESVRCPRSANWRSSTRTRAGCCRSARPPWARPAARLLRVSCGGRAELFADRSRYRQRACCSPSFARRARSIRPMVARPGDGPDAGDAGRRTSIPASATAAPSTSNA